MPHANRKALRFSLTYGSLLLLLSGCGGGGSSPVSGTPVVPTSQRPASTSIVVGGLPATITEYTSPDEPVWMTVAPNGDAWFQSHSSVNSITPAGDIRSFGAPGIEQYSEFQQMALGADGAMWFTATVGPNETPQCPVFPAVPSARCNTIARVTGAGDVTRVIDSIGAFENLPVNTRNQQNVVAAGPNHEMWFAFCAGPEAPFANPCGRYRYISLREDGTIDVDGKLPLVDNAGNGYYAQGMVQGPDGNMYLTARLNVVCPPSIPAQVIFRIDPQGHITHTFAFGAVGGFIALGPDGNLWTNAGTNGIARVNLAGFVTLFAVPTPNAGVNVITAGNDGAIWFTEFTAAKIGRITMDGTLSEYPLTPGSAPAGIASLPGEFQNGHGRIWFAEQFANKIGKIEF